MMSWRGGMYRIRSNVRRFTGLALFALALQIIITFDHIHLDGLLLAPADAASSIAVGKGAFVKSESQHQKSHGSTGNDCPVCALIQLASTSTPPMAPSLPVPAILTGTVLEVPQAVDFVTSVAFAFQARGPPGI